MEPSAAAPWDRCPRRGSGYGSRCRRLRSASKDASSTAWPSPCTTAARHGIRRDAFRRRLLQHGSKTACPGAVQVGTVDAWTWVSSNPAAFSGSRAHQSALASGTHQHYFYGATATMSGSSRRHPLHVRLPRSGRIRRAKSMLQWNDGTWEHRAYWGANMIGWVSTELSAAAPWDRCPRRGSGYGSRCRRAAVGLEGRVVNGMAFTLYNGRATWDQAGKF